VSRAAARHATGRVSLASVCETVQAATDVGLSAEACAKAWAEGDALSLEQATDLALAALEELSVPK
jgi:hypothetical protein